MLLTTKPRDAEARQFVAEQKTLASIDVEVDNFMAQQELIDPPAQPTIKDGGPANPDAPENTAAALGGFLSIHAPWRRD